MSSLIPFLNSPMAVDATRIFRDHRAEHRLTLEQCDATCRGVQIINSVEESERRNARTDPMIIISASGMATGGRVIHHIRAFAPDQQTLTGRPQNSSRVRSWRVAVAVLTANAQARLDRSQSLIA